jgi:glyoxylase-like metal-dependent hydrolase (beta-lactamase superfamily II)
LIQSIKKNLLTLPAETIVYPGHGPVTTIGREKTTNPFL